MISCHDGITPDIVASMASDDRGADHSQADLNALHTDRARLASRLATPWTLMVAAGAGMAWYVAGAATSHPGADAEAGSGWILSWAILCLVVYLVQRETGVRFRRVGGRGWAMLLGLGVLTFSMFSVSLGIVSLGYRVWAAVPVAVTWVLGTLGSGFVFRSCVESMNRA